MDKPWFKSCRFQAAALRVVKDQGDLLQLLEKAQRGPYPGGDTMPFMEEHDEGFPSHLFFWCKVEVPMFHSSTFYWSTSHFPYSSPVFHQFRSLDVSLGGQRSSKLHWRLGSQWFRELNILKQAEEFDGFTLKILGHLQHVDTIEWANFRYVDIFSWFISMF